MTIMPLSSQNWVELRGFEPLTPSMRIRFSPFGRFDPNRQRPAQRLLFEKVERT